MEILYYVLASIFAIGIIYLIVTAVITRIQDMRGGKQCESARDYETTRPKIEKMQKSDKYFCRDLYSPEEIATCPAKASVKLYRFGIDKKTDFVLICPGGGYGMVATEPEGFIPAIYINELGYNAFVLDYRVGKDCSLYAPLEDLQRALEYVKEHADELNVNADGYALMGYSAGGNLIGLFGDAKMGYQTNVGKPKALMMGYPWCNLNDKANNPWRKISFKHLNACGVKYMLGGRQELFDTLLVPLHVDRDYPATFIVHGTADTLVPIETHSDVLVEKLKQNDVPCEYIRAEGVYHGIGVCKGTAGEGWITKAVDFWQKQ